MKLLGGCFVVIVAASTAFGNAMEWTDIAATESSITQPQDTDAPDASSGTRCTPMMISPNVVAGLPLWSSLGFASVPITLLLARQKPDLPNSEVRIVDLQPSPILSPAASVPEPATMLLLGTGLACLAASVRKRRKTANTKA